MNLFKSQSKNWSEIKANDSWALFKIISEFVDGYEKMNMIGPCVSFFGSARTPSDDTQYQLTVDIAEAVAVCSEMTGDAITEEVLDGIFSRFCVGK